MEQRIIREILSKYTTVAVVGLSSNSSKPSYVVAEYLKNHGYHIIPVNPFAEEILREKSYRSLAELPAGIQRTVEIVDIFRRSEDVQIVVEQAIQMRNLHGTLKAVWMQLGIVNEKAAEIARKAGLLVVMDKCMKLEHQKLSDQGIKRQD